MTELITKIGEYIESFANDYASPVVVKNWGFVELVKRESRGRKNDTVTSQPIPMTITGTHEREQVSLDDTKDFIFWTRAVGVASPVDDEDQWGIKPSRRLSVPLRIVIAHIVELGEDLVYQLVRDFPKSILVTGYDFVFVEDIGVDPDHETIHDEELGKTNYEKHRFPWNIYVINLSVEFSRCLNFEPVNLDDVITDDGGNFLTVT